MQLDLVDFALGAAEATHTNDLVFYADCGFELATMVATDFGVSVLRTGESAITWEPEPESEVYDSDEARMAPYDCGTVVWHGLAIGIMSAISAPAYVTAPTGPEIMPEEPQPVYSIAGDNNPVPPANAEAIIDLGHKLQRKAYGFHIAADDEGGLSLELRLNPLDHLTVEMSANGILEAAISSKGRGITSFPSEGIGSLLRDLALWQTTPQS